jgi:hypothetical protein
VSTGEDLAVDGNPSIFGHVAILPQARVLDNLKICGKSITTT